MTDRERQMFERLEQERDDARREIVRLREENERLRGEADRLRRSAALRVEAVRPARPAAPASGWHGVGVDLSPPRPRGGGFEAMDATATRLAGPVERAPSDRWAKVMIDEEHGR